MSEKILYGSIPRCGKTLLFEIIQDISEAIMRHNASKIEKKLQELTSNGCECGNRKDFTLIYCEQDFKYIRCEHCRRPHYVPEVYTSDHIDKWRMKMLKNI